MHEKYIDKIIQSTDNDKMYELRDVLEDMIMYIKNTDEQIYSKIECDLYEIAEGKKLNEEKAMDWVYNMKPNARWTLNDIDNLMSNYEINLPRISAYVVLNMLYSDFSDILGEDLNEETINRYIKAAEDWYYDEDAYRTEDEKIYYYWKYIVN